MRANALSPLPNKLGVCVQARAGRRPRVQPNVFFIAYKLACVLGVTLSLSVVALQGASRTRSSGYQSIY